MRTAIRLISKLTLSTLFVTFLALQVNAKGAYVKLVGPENNTFISTLKPKFVWEIKGAKNVIEYNLKIAEDANFTVNPKEFKTTDPYLFLTIPYLKKSKQYFWTVQASYNDKKKGKSTTEWAFSNKKTKAPFSFTAAQTAAGTFSFEEGQKEEVNKLGNQENLRKLTSGDKNEWAPAVSKDGKYVAFCSDKLGNTEICVKNLSEGGAGEVQRTFSTSGQNNSNPFWMKGSENFMFYSNRINPNGYNIFETTKGKSLVDRQTSKTFIGPVEELTGACMDNDRKVVYTEKTANNPEPLLWLMDLTDNSFTVLAPGMFPDMRNQAIVYCSKKSGNYNIWTMRLEGNSIYDESQLTFGDDFCYDPSWSPDGERIAYVSHKSGNSDIWVMDATGNNATQITFNPMVDRWPRWIDNQTIVFQSNRDKNKNGQYSWDLWTTKVLKH